jgi:hypothetical protein
MMHAGVWTVVSCTECGDLHPVYFDGYAGIDGDDVCDCPVAGKLELADMPYVRLRELVVVERKEA